MAETNVSAFFVFTYKLVRIFANEFNYNGYKDELRFILDSKIPKMYNCSILVIQLYNKENEEENV